MCFTTHLGHQIVALLHRIGFKNFGELPACFKRKQNQQHQKNGIKQFIYHQANELSSCFLKILTRDGIKNHLTNTNLVGKLKLNLLSLWKEPACSRHKLND